MRRPAMVDRGASDARAAAYGDFATLMSAALTQQDVQALRAAAGLGSLGILADRTGCREPLARAQSILRGGADAAAVATTLNRAFCALFVGVNGPQKMVPPFESAYCGATGHLFQEPAVEMQRLLEAHGLAPVGEWRESSDHLATELALVEHLVRTGADETAMLDRLRGWVPRFAELCIARDPSGFYASIATLLTGFLTDERGAEPATLAPPAADVA